jgi:hypothetical protein
MLSREQLRDRFGRTLAHAVETNCGSHDEDDDVALDHPAREAEALP